MTNGGLYRFQLELQLETREELHVILLEIFLFSSCLCIPFYLDFLCSLVIYL